ncbi:MAG TPA: YciI family protein [Bacteroidota bacterium]|nr:YciI family protein [Bacteroidota bacterium]
MKYLCLIYLDENLLQAMPAEQYNAVVRQCLEYEKDVAKSGKLLAVEALEPVQTATTVRVRSGKTTVTDGPFAETKEQLAGFFLVDAQDLNEAVRIAEGMPQARIGSIEVRPIKDLSRHVRHG